MYPELSDSEIREIRRKYQKGFSLKKLECQHKTGIVTYSSIRLIVNGNVRKDAGGPIAG